MKYDYKKLNIEIYIHSLYEDGFKHSEKYSNEVIKALLLRATCRFLQTTNNLS